MGISNIIFDLGGVILNLDQSLTEKAFSRIRRSPRRDREGSLPFFLQFERGEITESEFRNSLRDLLDTDVGDEEMDEAWNAMLLDLPPARLNLLATLAAGHRLFLLSNTNSIHKLAFETIISNAGLMDQFQTPFEMLYYSHEMGMRKPEPEIFLYVLEKNGLSPRETVFVDDTLSNVEAANRVGIRGVHLNHGTILDLDFASHV